MEALGFPTASLDHDEKSCIFLSYELGVCHKFLQFSKGFLLKFCIFLGEGEFCRRPAAQAKLPPKKLQNLRGNP